LTASAKGTHTARYRPGVQPSEPDGRLYSPVFLKNSPPMIAALTRLIGDDTGAILEIGSGTGQHAAAFSLALPHLDWIPSDPDPIHRQSVAAWTAALGAPAAPPLDIDAGRDWANLPSVRALGGLTAVLAMNVAHIAPLSVTAGLFAGAARSLAPGGRLLLYGPFLRDGAYSGAGDRQFDEGLRSENPEWGLRDREELALMASKLGVTLSIEFPMPSNNLLLVFKNRTSTNSA